MTHSESFGRRLQDLRRGIGRQSTRFRHIMRKEVQEALERGGIADITTIGRKTGKPRRIEIYFHQLDGAYYIAGRPGFKRDWLANLSAHPGFTLHLKRGVTADLPATATVLTNPDERAAVLFRVLTESWGTDPDEARAGLSRWVESSPLVRFAVH